MFLFIIIPYLRNSSEAHVLGQILKELSFSEVHIYVLIFP